MCGLWKSETWDKPCATSTPETWDQALCDIHSSSFQVPNSELLSESIKLKKEMPIFKMGFVGDSLSPIAHKMCIDGFCLGPGKMVHHHQASWS